MRRARELGRVELDDVVVDARAGRRELAAHRHEEGIECVILHAVNRDLTAVEAATELDASLLVDIRRVPCLVERARLGELRKLLLELERVEGSPLGYHCGPLLAEGGLELVCVDGQVLARGQGTLLCDGIVVLVDEALAVDFFACDDALRQDRNALLVKLGLDGVEYCWRVCVRLGKDKGSVLLGRREPADAARRASATQQEL